MPGKFSAHYIFPGNSQPLKKGIIITDDKGVILEVIDTGGELSESHALKFFNGIIIPGFPIVRSQGVKVITMEIKASIPHIPEDETITVEWFLDEMKDYQMNNPSIDLKDLIDRSTFHLARTLNIDKLEGSIEKGKKPGLILLTHIDFREMKLTSQTEVKVLI